MATKDEIFAFAAQEAERQGVPLSLVQGVVDAESGGRFDAVGPKTRSGQTAFGPMQLMSSTAKELGVDRMDWQDNIRGGVKYLGQLSQRFANPDLVVAAYNAGPGAVERYNGIPPFKETQNYVQKVKSFMSKSTQDDDFVPFDQGPQQGRQPKDVTIDVAFPQAMGTGQNTQSAQATQTSNDDFVPFEQAPAIKPPNQFLQDVRASFNPMDVLRGKTTTGQLAMGTGNLINTGIQNVLGSMGFSDEYLGRTRNQPVAPAAPTQSVSDILSGVYKTATERPGLLVGGMATGMLDPLNLALPGGIQKSLASATPRALAQAAPRTVTAAQNVGTAALSGGITSGAAQLANTGTINPAQLGNEMAAGALMSAPVAGVGAMTTPRQPAQLNQSQRVAQQAIAEGATLPPTQVNPSYINRIIEGISGKQQTSQIASVKNQQLVNDQARKALKLAPDVEITPLVLQQFRDEKGLAYDALRANPAYYADKKFFQDLNKETTRLQSMKTLDTSAELELLNNLKVLNFTGDELVNSIKRLRNSSQTNSSPLATAKNKDLGQAQKFAAQQLEALADRNLKNFNQPDVLDNFKQARQDIAKSYTIQKALNATTGNVSGADLGNLARQGRIVPAELQTLANAAGAYPTAFQNVARIGSVPGFSPLDVGTAGVAAAAAGNPTLLASAAARPTLRSIAVSPRFQRNMLPNTTPQAPGLLNMITTDPLANYGIGMLPQYGVQ
jgi:hypothetical protein